MKPTDSQISPARTFIVHDSGQVVPAGMTAQIVTRPQVGALRPVWLRIDPEIAPSFWIDDVRVGNRSQFLCAQSVPASHFMHRGGLSAEALPLLALLEAAREWVTLRGTPAKPITPADVPRLSSAADAVEQATRTLEYRMAECVVDIGAGPRGRAFRCETIQTAMDFTMFVTNRSDRDLAFCATWECETVDMRQSLAGSWSDIVSGTRLSAEAEQTVAQTLADITRECAQVSQRLTSSMEENHRLRGNLARAEEGWRQAVDTVHEICFGATRTDAEVRESVLASARAKLMPTVHCDDSHYQHLSEACPHGYGWKCPHAVNVPAPRTLEEVKQDFAARDLPATNAEAGDHFQFNPTEPGENGAGIASAPIDAPAVRERVTRCPSFGWDPHGDE